MTNAPRFIQGHFFASNLRGVGCRESADYHNNDYFKADYL